MKRIALLGSTGSIGKQTLDLVRRMPDRLGIFALAAGSNGEMLADQALEFGAGAVALFDDSRRHALDSVLPRQTVKLYGEESLEKLAILPDVDVVLVAVSGSIGTRATIAALCAGKTVALATKEVLVSAGPVVMSAAATGNGRLLPIDSEHSGVMQCLEGERRESVERLWLTASGGPFREWTAEQIAGATLEDALKHPTWRMGNKITVDSATLMNKGLEMIEARWLFDIPVEKIGVVVHPQSVVHSLLQMSDGSVIAQLGLPDMRLPIQYALLYPERLDSGLPKLDPTQMGMLTFEPPDEDRFPCLRLARRAITVGGTMPAVMNAANEAVVEMFLRGLVKFVDISDTIEQIMDRHEVRQNPNLDQILIADDWARRAVFNS